MNELNLTQICGEIANKTTEEGVKTLSELFLGSYLIYWIGSFLFTLIIALFIIRKDWGKFFTIFVIPVIIGFFVFLFTFIIPLIPLWLGELFKGVLG